MSRGRKAKHFRRANGMGSVRKLSGNRRKPWQALVTVSREYDQINDTYKQKTKSIGTFETRVDAELALASYLQNPYDFDEKNITFGEIAKIWFTQKEKTLAEETAKKYMIAYTKYCKVLENVKMCDIKTYHLQQIIDNSGVGSGRKNVIKIVMAGCFDYAEKNDIVSKNYARYVKIANDDVKLVRKVFTKEEIEKLKAVNGRDEKIWLLLLYTGMRVSELLDMKRCHCNLEERYLDIVKAKNKSSVRKVPIHDEIYTIVEEFYNENNEYLVTNDSSKQYVYNTFRKKTTSKCNGHRLHDTRHTFITQAKKCKLDDLLLKKIVGHTPTDITTKVYTHVSFNDLFAEINKLHY